MIGLQRVQYAGSCRAISITLRAVCWFAASVALLAADARAATAPLPPHLLQPAVVAPGDPLVVNAEAGDLPVRLEGAVSIELTPAWTVSAADGAQAVCEVPAEVPAGRYDLLIGEERRPGAVTIIPSWPTPLLVAFATGTTPESLALAARGAEAAGAVLLVFLQASDADGLTYAAYAEAAATRAVPVQTLGGTAGSGTHLPAVLRLGQDALLLHDPAADHFGDGAGRLHRLRREHRAARWSVAVWPAYDPLIAMREQLILFADDAVEVFISTLGALPDDAEAAGLPGFWPRTRFEPLAAGAADTLLLVQLDSRQARPVRMPLGGPEAAAPEPEDAADAPTEAD